MRTVLRFAAPARDREGRRVREAEFVRESSLPLATACMVANGVRERFAARLAPGVAVDLFEPMPVEPGFIDRLLADAMVFRFEAAGEHMWLLLGAGAVAGLVGAAFRESVPPEHTALSALERRTLQTMARELAQLCAPIYGEITHFAPTHDYRPLYEAATYFELRLGCAVPVHVGIVLARDPDEHGGTCLGARQLADVSLTLWAVAGSCDLTLEQLAGLEIGALLPMIRRENAHLMAGDVVVARGTCGSANGRNAFLVGLSGEHTTA